MRDFDYEAEAKRLKTWEQQLEDCKTTDEFVRRLAGVARYVAGYIVRLNTYVQAHPDDEKARKVFFDSLDRAQELVEILKLVEKKLLDIIPLLILPEPKEKRNSEK